jgi:hypothetical protein
MSFFTIMPLAVSVERSYYAPIFIDNPCGNFLLRRCALGQCDGIA